jgi:hypothetical protein
MVVSKRGMLGAGFSLLDGIGAHDERSHSGRDGADGTDERVAKEQESADMAWPHYSTGHVQMSIHFWPRMVEGG